MELMTTVQFGKIIYFQKPKATNGENIMRIMSVIKMQSIKFICLTSHGNESD